MARLQDAEEALSALVPSTGLLVKRLNKKTHLLFTIWQLTLIHLLLVPEGFLPNLCGELSSFSKAGIITKQGQERGVQGQPLFAYVQNLEFLRMRPIKQKIRTI